MDDSLRPAVPDISADANPPLVSLCLQSVVVVPPWGWTSLNSSAYVM